MADEIFQDEESLTVGALVRGPGPVQGYLHEPWARSQEPEESDSDDLDSELDDDEEDTEGRLGNTSWCSCGNCSPQPTVHESHCCREVGPVNFQVEQMDLDCMIDHPGYQGNCLNRWVVETSFYEFLENYGQVGDDEPIHELYRHVAYRRFVRWIWYRLGKGKRKILPSCVITRIREEWPSQEYTGFRYATHL